MSDTPSWNQRLARYAPSTRRSVAQLALTAALFAAAVAAAGWARGASELAALPFCALAGLFLVRLVIIQHDCGHRSFLRSVAACDWIGRGLSVLTLTPYAFWRRDHDKHHANSGNLDRRGFGDIDTLTVSEYRALGPWGRLRYRAYRHPAVIFGLGPTWQFLVKARLPIGLRGMAAKKDAASILLTNAAVAALLAAAGLAFGFGAVAAVWLPIVLVAATAGIWMFFIQHQFPDTYWRRKPEWDFTDAAFKGCSFYDLPGWAHWLTGWIGYHHIHHLAARIPNYELARAFREVAELRDNARAVSLRESLSFVGLSLWSEDMQRLVSFREAAGCRA